MKKEYIIGIIILVLLALALGLLFSSPKNPNTGGASSEGTPYKEIVDPSGFVNTGGEPIKIGDYIGKKVILLDVMTYSCINCQRTFPYVNAWYEKYKDDGFIVIGIHTPEFAFEKDIGNVEQAMQRFGIKFPVVLDNDYGTWNAYGNSYWPRKYLIDIHGNIVYDHIGEGNYDETEMKIQELLEERKQVLGEGGTVDSSLAANTIPEVKVSTQSPETYIGAGRNEFLGNGTPGKTGLQNYVLPSKFNLNTLYLGGEWNMTTENAESVKDSRVVYRYDSQNVYLVASADKSVDIEVWQDGKLISDSSGADVHNGLVSVKESRLYTLVHNQTQGEHVLELRIKGENALLYAITFG